MSSQANAIRNIHRLLAFCRRPSPDCADASLSQSSLHANRTRHYADDPRRRPGKHAAELRRSAARLWRRRAAGDRPAAGTGRQFARSGSGSRGAARNRSPPLRRPIHPWRRLGQLTPHQAARLATYRPDVVHTHSAKGGLLGRAAGMAERVPAVVHAVHGAPFHPYQNSAPASLLSRVRTLGRAAAATPSSASPTP